MGLIGYRSIPQRDFWIVEKAEFESSDFNKDLFVDPYQSLDPKNSKLVSKMQLHRIKEGAGYTIAIREYYPIPIGFGDLDSYKKVSIWLPELRTGKYEIGKNGVRAYFSEGNSAFPRIGGCSEEPEGVVEVLNLSSNLIPVRVKLFVRCGDEVQFVDHKYYLQRKQFVQVTPWIGKMGEHLYQESFRRTY